MSNEFERYLLSIDSVVEEAVKSGPLRGQEIVILYTGEEPEILCRIFDYLRDNHSIPINYSMRKMVNGEETERTEGKYLLDLRKMEIDYPKIVLTEIQKIILNEIRLDESNIYLQVLVSRSVKSYKKSHDDYQAFLKRGTSLPSTRTFPSN